MLVPWMRLRIKARGEDKGGEFAEGGENVWIRPHLSGLGLGRSRGSGMMGMGWDCRGSGIILL